MDLPCSFGHADQSQSLTCDLGLLIEAHAKIYYLQDEDIVLLFEKDFDMGFSSVFGYVPKRLLRDSIKRSGGVGRDGLRDVHTVVGSRHSLPFPKLLNQRLERRRKTKIIQNRGMEAM